MSGDQWDAFKQYQSQLRQSQTERAQRISETQQQKENESRQQEIIREQARQLTEERQATERQLAEQKALEKRLQEEEARTALLAQSAEALRVANQNRHEALQIALQKLQEAKQTVRGVSPIEASFFAEWIARHPEIELKPQHKIGRFRVDFAHPETMVVIELDGHQYHHSRKDRTKDAQRARWIQAQSWQVIRFTGTEIHADVTSCVSQVAEIISTKANMRQGTDGRG